MPAFKRWRFVDPYTGSSYTFPLNPNQMTSPFPERAITSQTTTAVDGQALIWEGGIPPFRWTFGGSILDSGHYEALRSWVYGSHTRVMIYDHFGRGIPCVFVKFDPTPKRSVGRYWRHEYQINCLVVGTPTAPTVSEVPA